MYLMMKLAMGLVGCQFGPDDMVAAWRIHITFYGWS